MDLQLASKSPRRRELLDQIGVRYSVVDVNVPELRAHDESPEAYVCRLAKDKASAGIAHYPDLPTMGADTIVVAQGGEILEKPADEEVFYRMMRKLSGSDHQVMTAVAVAYNDRDDIRLVCDCSVTNVVFRDIQESEMRAYWQSGEPQDKAGGYAIQGCGAVFVKRIEGSYSGVVGLPIEVVSPMLQKIHVPVWNLR